MSETIEALTKALQEERARIDVLERVVTIFMAHADPAATALMEVLCRNYVELYVTSDDPATAGRLERADMAAVKLADLLREALKATTRP